MSETAPADLRAFVPRGPQQWLVEEPERRHRDDVCSLVFVDISGFTAMSERLARLGRRGAEEVTDLLNITFTALLAVAYRHGGSLLKFGGDALLLQFVGRDHVLRAVGAAWGMRTRLRELQPLDSSAGRINLRMTVGVHTGALDQFLVGVSHRELLLVGPMVSTVVDVEGSAAAGEVRVSQAVVDALDGQLRIRTEDRHPALVAGVEAPSVPLSELDGRDDTREVAPLLLSSAVRRRLGAGVPEAEHRQAVVGFVKFTGTDALLAAHGPAHTADVLEGLVDLVDRALAPDDVCLVSTDVDVDGGKFVLAAGVPTASEYDGERMLRALRRLLDGNVPVPVKVGVHAGPVFAGVVGPPFRMTYTIIGDAVNLAARVMGHAHVGDLLATPDVMNRSLALFEHRALEPFLVKGKERPVEAVAVGRVTATRARRLTPRFPLAGRQAEMAQLLETHDRAMDGQGGVVQLVGPAGLGKSRLVDELHERRPSTPLLLASCNEYEVATPFHVAAQLLRAVIATVEDVEHVGVDEIAAVVLHRAPGLVEGLPLLGDVLGLDFPETDETRDLTQAFRLDRAVATTVELVESLLPGAMLVIDDMHWIDPESARVVTALAEAATSRRPWMMVVSARRRVVLDPLGDVPDEVIELEPLDEHDARAFVYAAVERGLVSFERGHRLLERAGGNPFFIEQLLRVSGEDDELPADVETLIQSQLDRLPVQVRDLLGFAAVLGDEAELDLLAAVTERPEVVEASTWEGLDNLVESVSDGVLRFHHAMVHDAAYGRLPYRRRRELHARAAAVLEGTGSARADRLALHNHRAGDWERAWHWSLVAAGEAEDRFANLTAAQQFRRAVEVGRRVPGLARDEVAAVWERLGDALLHAGSYDEAVEAYRRARRDAAPERQAYLAGQVGKVRERQGSYRSALQWFTRGIGACGPGQADQRARLLVESAVVRIRQGRPQEVRRLATQASELSEATEVRARVAYVRAWAAMLEGGDDIEEQQRTLELFERSDDIIGQGLAWNIISMAAYARGEWDTAADAYERARTLRRRVGDEVAAAVASGNLGELLADQGRFDRARPLLEEARAVCGAAGFAVGHHFATMTLGRLAARQGDYERAQVLLEEALDALVELRAEPMVREARLRLAELALFRRDTATAQELAAMLDETRDLGARSQRVVGDRIRCAAALAAGDLTGAVDIAARLAPELDGEADYEAALAHTTVATAFERAGDGRAVEAWQRARELLDALGVVVTGPELVLGPDLVSS